MLSLGGPLEAAPSPIDFEAIADALFALLQTAAEFLTTGRRLLMWSEVAEQPALFLRMTKIHVEQRPRLPPLVTIENEVWLYADAGANPDVAPSIALNRLIASVFGILNPPPTLGQLTLGGLVTHCRIEGQIDYWSGDLDGQAIAVLPVKILVPGVSPTGGPIT